MPFIRIVGCVGLCSTDSRPRCLNKNRVADIGHKVNDCAASTLRRRRFTSEPRVAQRTLGLGQIRNQTPTGFYNGHGLHLGPRADLTMPMSIPNVSMRPIAEILVPQIGRSMLRGKDDVDVNLD